MLESYQDRRELEEPEAVGHSFATVAQVYEDGVALFFDGADAPGQKHYKCNRSITFLAGDRVKIARDSGTYVVEYPVGAPKEPDPEEPEPPEPDVTVKEAENVLYGHTGNTLGFFGHAGVAQKRVLKASSSAQLSSVIYTLNNLLQCLYEHGLISF